MLLGKAALGWVPDGDLFLFFLHSAPREKSFLYSRSEMLNSDIKTSEIYN